MNMSYCRFHNTRLDFEDCLDAIQRGDELSEDEERNAYKLYKDAMEYITAYEETHDNV